MFTAFACERSRSTTSLLNTEIACALVIAGYGACARLRSPPRAPRSSYWKYHLWLAQNAESETFHSVIHIGLTSVRGSSAACASKSAVVSWTIRSVVAESG